jgi:hypothetical protein
VHRAERCDVCRRSSAPAWGKRPAPRWRFLVGALAAVLAFVVLAVQR